jgi:wyosine [tRNA(Phe)-imidazoG37] synthetase (radical SAM superfamily)
MGCASDYGRPCEPDCSSCRRELNKIDREIEEKQQCKEMELLNRGKELRHSFDNYMRTKILFESEKEKEKLLSNLKKDYDEKVKNIEKKIEQDTKDLIKAKWEELVKTLS